jgi:hypothetical protein
MHNNVGHRPEVPLEDSHDVRITMSEFRVLEYAATGLLEHERSADEGWPHATSYRRPELD